MGHRVLARQLLLQRLHAQRSDIDEQILALLKLPPEAAAWALTSAAPALPLDRFTLAVMTLVAALPSASNVSLLAERFGADTGRVARIILLTTAAAFLTFSVAVSLVR